jgi:hypothetical protein
VVFEHEGKEPLHGFMRVDRGMVIVSGSGRHKERRVGSSPPELIARLLLSELENAAHGEADEKTEGPEENGSWVLPGPKSGGSARQWWHVAAGRISKSVWVAC